MDTGLRRCPGWHSLSPLRDLIAVMDTMPMTTTPVADPSPDREKCSLWCPECREEGDREERPDIRDLSIEELLAKDSGRGHTLREMSDMAREMFGPRPSNTESGAMKTRDGGCQSQRRGSRKGDRK